jgi:hypothetical protein
LRWRWNDPRNASWALPNFDKFMILLNIFSISKFSLWAECASKKIAHFLDFPTSLFLLADSKYAAASRLGLRTPKKHALVRPAAVSSTMALHKLVS